MPASTSSKTSVGTCATWRRHGLDREAQARELAARSDLGERLRRPCPCARQPGTRRFPARRPSTSAAAGSATSKRPPAIARSCMAAGHLAPTASSPPSCAGRQLLRFRRRMRRAPPPPACAALPTSPPAPSSSRRRFAAASFAGSSPGGTRYLRAAPCTASSRLFDLAQALRVELDPVAVVPQAVRRFLQLDARRLERIEDFAQPRIVFERAPVSRLTTAFNCARLAALALRQGLDCRTAPPRSGSRRARAGACCVGQLLPFARR